MNEKEISSQIEKNTKQRKIFSTNRSLSGVLCVYLIYITLKDIKSEPGTWYFYVIMSLLIIAAGFIALKDTLRIKRIDDELKSLREMLSKENNETN